MDHPHYATADEAKKLIYEGSVPDGLFVRGHLDLSDDKSLTELPVGISGAWSLNLSGCTALETLPDHCEINRLTLNNCTALKTLPAGLKCFELQMQNTTIESLPDDIQIDYKLDLTGNRHLTSLPDGLQVGSLVIVNCTSLTKLPEDLDLYFLDASGCSQLREWGTTGSIQVGNINLSDCVNLTYLPNWMTTISQLNIRNCGGLTQLPQSMTITSQLELQNSGLTGIPDGVKEARLLWNEVQINERVAFHPEELSAKEILETANLELRRVMIERLGYEEFFRQADAQELDRDVDPGGIRRLLRVEFDDSNNQRRRFGQREEPLVCLSVLCPSTARHYIIRVPPTMRTCHQAAAWIAGFDDPALYTPLTET